MKKLYMKKQIIAGIVEIVFVKNYPLNFMNYQNI